MTEHLQKEIEHLRRQKTQTLKVRYRELFGEESKSFNHAHLLRRIAWRLQAIAEGDLSERARTRADELASDADVRLRAPRAFWRELAQRAAQNVSGRDVRLPPIGTALVREYQGRNIVVQVLEHGFEYEGRTFDSLSSIASTVSGTRWNGFAFFRLKKQVPHG